MKVGTLRRFRLSHPPLPKGVKEISRVSTSRDQQVNLFIALTSIYRLPGERKQISFAFTVYSASLLTEVMR